MGPSCAKPIAHARLLWFSLKGGQPALWRISHEELQEAPPVRTGDDVTALWIACFAVLGAWARYGQSLGVQRLMGRDFPWATLSINVFGSFLIGFLSYALVTIYPLSVPMRTGIMVGGIGTYTTFSTFSLEAMVLFENGQTIRGLAYLATSLVLGLAAVLLGGLMGPHLS